MYSKKIATSLNVEIYVFNAFRFHSKFYNRPNWIVAKLTLKQYKRYLIESGRKSKRLILLGKIMLYSLTINWHN